MPKTDKELTAEIVIALINNWNNSKGIVNLNAGNVSSAIETIYNKIRSLPENR